MKMTANNLLEKLSAQTILNLTSSVPEVLAKDLIQKKEKIFSAADLWNIQRNGRSGFRRRMSF
jgi:hypothetical protein